MQELVLALAKELNIRKPESEDLNKFATRILRLIKQRDNELEKHKNRPLIQDMTQKYIERLQEDIIFEEKHYSKEYIESRKNEIKQIRFIETKITNYNFNVETENEDSYSIDFNTFIKLTLIEKEPLLKYLEFLLQENLNYKLTEDTYLTKFKIGDYEDNDYAFLVKISNNEISITKAKEIYFEDIQRERIFALIQWKDEEQEEAREELNKEFFNQFNKE